MLMSQIKFNRIAFQLFTGKNNKIKITAQLYKSCANVFQYISLANAQTCTDCTVYKFVASLHEDL